MRFPKLLLVILLAVSIVCGYSVFNKPISDFDLWFHLSTGEYIVNNLDVPVTDIFSWTSAGEKWVVHSWLSDVIFWKIFAAYGHLGLKIFIGVVGGLTALALYLAAYIRSRSYLISLLTIIIPFFVIYNAWTARPQIISYLFVSLLILILELKKFRPRALLVLPFLFLIWVNIHAQFLLGFVVWGSYLFFELITNFLKGRVFKLSKHKFELSVLVFSALATLINPLFLEPHLYSLISLPSREFDIVEWKSIINFLNSFSTQLFVLMIAGVFITIAAGFRKKLFSQAEFYIGLFFALLPFMAQRMMIYSSFVVFVVLSQNIKDTILKAVRSFPQYDRWVTASIMCLLLISVLSTSPKRLLVNLSSEPVAAASFIERNLITGRMFNTYEYGGYLLYRWPEKKVFIDGRFDPYVKNSVAKDYDQIHSASAGYENLINQKYSLDVFLISYSKSAITGYKKSPEIYQKLLQSDDFALVYIDRLAMIFLRRGGDNDDFISNHELKYVEKMFLTNKLEPDELEPATKELKRFKDSNAYSNQIIEELLERIETQLKVIP